MKEVSGGRSWDGVERRVGPMRCEAYRGRHRVAEPLVRCLFNGIRYEPARYPEPARHVCDLHYRKAPWGHV